MTHCEFIKAMGVLAIFCLLFSATAPTAGMVIGAVIAGGLIVMEVVQVIREDHRSWRELR